MTGLRRTWFALMESFWRSRAARLLRGAKAAERKADDYRRREACEERAREGRRA